MEFFWTAYWTWVSFVFGGIVGSFLNVCIWRLPREESLWEPPSHCPSCNHRLRFFPDMVPMLSQLWSRGRCRYCGVAFSWRYFWVEALTSTLFAAIYLRYAIFNANPALTEVDRNWCALAGMIFAAALVAIFFIDLETFAIPDVLVLVAFLAGVAKDLYLVFVKARPLSEPVLGTVPLPMSLLAALVAFWLLWQFAALASAAMAKEAMGAGDPLLLGAMASFLIPWPLVVLAFMVAVILGTIGGVLGSVLHREPEQVAAEAPEVTAMEEESPAAAYATGEEAVAELGEAPLTALPAQEAIEAADTAPDEEAAEPETEPSDADESLEEQPLMPPASRWGRVWTVIGTWIAVGALWGAGEGWRQNPAIGIGIGAAGFGLAAAVLVFGIRLWVLGDYGKKSIREWWNARSQEEEGENTWSQEMDEFFEGDPGPRVIPFGPYLVTGTLVAMLFGYPILMWYLTKFMYLGPATVSQFGWD
jgi:leader peptidase (prepilin peptidase) / N-methyltransferase